MSSILSAILLALALAATQALHGGLLVPAFAVPGGSLLVAAALPAVFAAIRNPAPTGAGSFGVMMVFFGYLVWRCVHAPDGFLGRVEMGQVLAASTAFAIAFGGLGNNRARLVFVGLIVGFGAVQASIGFWQFARGGFSAPLGWFSEELRGFYEARFATRAHGFYLNPNHFAWLMSWAALVCLALACWGRMSVVMRVVLAYLVLVFLAADVLSGSRSGAASLIAGLLVFVLTTVAAVASILRHGRLIVILGTLALVALGLGVGWAVYSSNWVMQARIDAILFPDVRGFLLEHGWRQLQTAPLIGAGPGIFLYAARLYRTGNQSGDAIFAHNDWLQGMVEYGFVGLALAIIVVVALLVGGWGRLFAEIRRRAESGSSQSNSAAILLGALCATVTFALHSFTDFNLHVPANALLAGATAGLLAGAGATPSPRNSLPAAVWRGFVTLAIAGLAISLGVYTWRHAEPDYRHLLAVNAMSEGKVAAALFQTDEGLARAPNDAALLALRGRALYSYESARQFLTPEERTGTGEDFLRRGRRAIYSASTEAFKRAVTQRPEERSLRIDLSRALFETRQRREGRIELLEAIRLDPAHGFTYGAYGDYLTEMGKFNQALRIYELGAQLPGGGYPGREAQRMREIRDASPRPATLESLVPASTDPGNSSETSSDS